MSNIHKILKSIWHLLSSHYIEISREIYEDEKKVEKNEQFDEVMENALESIFEGR